VRSALYQERARVFLPLVTPGHVCKRCNLHKIISVLHRGTDLFQTNAYMEVEQKYERVRLKVLSIA